MRRIKLTSLLLVLIYSIFLSCRTGQIESLKKPNGSTYGATITESSQEFRFNCSGVEYTLYFDSLSENRIMYDFENDYSNKTIKSNPRKFLAPQDAVYCLLRHALNGDRDSESKLLAIISKLKEQQHRFSGNDWYDFFLFLKRTLLKIETQESLEFLLKLTELDYCAKVDFPHIGVGDFHFGYNLLRGCIYKIDQPKRQEYQDLRRSFYSTASSFSNTDEPCWRERYAYQKLYDVISYDIMNN